MAPFDLALDSKSSETWVHQRRIMPATAHKPKAQTTTTVRLPRGLYEQAQCVLKKGETDATSFNELVVDSLNEKLQQVKRRLIDEKFAEMRHDAAHHRESAVLAEHFASNDLETFRSSERENP